MNSTCVQIYTKIYKDIQRYTKIYKISDLLVFLLPQFWFQFLQFLVLLLPFPLPLVLRVSAPQVLVLRVLAPRVLAPRALVLRAWVPRV